MNALERALALHAAVLAATERDDLYYARMARCRALAALPSRWHARQFWIRADRMTARHRAALTNHAVPAEGRRRAA